MKLIDNIFSPIEHFEINYYFYFYIGCFDFSITSVTLYFFLITFFFFLCMIIFYIYKVLPSRFQLIIEEFYIFMLNIFIQQNSSYRTLKNFPFYFTIIIIIFLLNFTSLFSYNISLTGHIIITLTYSLVIFLGLIVIGFLNFRLTFLTLFYPKNVPNFLLIFLIFIEVLSFLIRPLSLAIRLFANMLAGHTLMGIFASFANFILNKVTLVLILPLIFCFLIVILEFGVSLIQTYVFYILITIYLSDVSKLH